MKIQEIRQMNMKKLIEELRKARRELSVKRFHNRTGQDQNTAKSKKTRKIIAQILTVIKELNTKSA